MANSFNVSSLVSKQMVQSLHARGKLINSVNTSYSKDFTQKKYTPGQTVTIDIEHQPTITSGRTASVQDIENITTSVTLGQFNGAYELTSMEKGYDVADWRKYSDKIAMRLVRKMETEGFITADQYCGNSVGAANGSDVDELKTWAQGRSKITDALAPDRNYFAAAAPLSMVELTDSLKGVYAPDKTISNQYLTGRMKSAAGMNFYESVSTRRMTAGTQDNTTPVTNGAAQSGSTLIIDGCDNGATITKGTKFTLTAVYAVDPETKVALSYLKQFTVTADSTADGSGNIAALPISPTIYPTTSSHQNVDALPGDGATLTLLQVSSAKSQSNLIYDRDAMTLVSVPLPKAVGANVHQYSNYNGINIRTGVGAWDATNDTQILRIDAVWAWGVLRPDHMCIVQGA